MFFLAANRSQTTSTSSSPADTIITITFTNDCITIISSYSGDAVTRLLEIIGRLNREMIQQNSLCKIDIKYSDIKYEEKFNCIQNVVIQIF
jgi:hypothetical protein